MPTKLHFSRRALMIGGGQAAAVLGLPGPLRAAETLPKITVTRDPSCGCCGNWIAHVKAAGFPVEVVEIPDVTPFKARLGVPDLLTSCHTAEVAGYVVEGHVPAEAIKRLLLERPQVTGIAVAGMPVGSPGMQVSGQTPQTYDVVIFSPGRHNVFARYRGAQQIAGRAG